MCRFNYKVHPKVARNAIQKKKQRWELGVGYLERETFDACLQLPATQRKLIREMILTFAKVHSESEAPSGKQ